MTAKAKGDHLMWMMVVRFMLFVVVILNRRAEFRDQDASFEETLRILLLSLKEEIDR